MLRERERERARRRRGGGGGDSPRIIQSSWKSLERERERERELAHKPQKLEIRKLEIGNWKYGKLERRGERARNGKIRDWRAWARLGFWSPVARGLWLWVCGEWAPNLLLQSVFVCCVLCVVCCVSVRPFGDPECQQDSFFSFLERQT